MVVAAGFLRRGIASELVRELIERAQNEAAPAILLEVRESNLPARGLYEKHGFRRGGPPPGVLSEIRRKMRFCTRFGLIADASCEVAVSFAPFPVCNFRTSVPLMRYGGNLSMKSH